MQKVRPETNQRIIVCGGRDWSDLETIASVLIRYDPVKVTIIQGEARGADYIAKNIALSLGFSVEGYYADWKRLGKSAGPERNKEMLDSGTDLVIAFPDPTSRGTWDMVRRAMAAGVEVEVINATD